MSSIKKNENLQEKSRISVKCYNVRFTTLSAPKFPLVLGLPWLPSSRANTAIQFAL